MTRYAVNSDEWYPVYDPFVIDYESDHHHELDDDLVRRYIAARDEHRRLLDEMERAMYPALASFQESKP
jgi:hypothetical protein